MTGWVGDIEKESLENETFRTVLFTGEHMQLTVKSLKAGEEIGLEAHHDRDQFLRVEQGSARVVMGPAEDLLDDVHELGDDWVVLVPAGTWHNVVKVRVGDLKPYSIYNPAEPPPRPVHNTPAATQ